MQMVETFARVRDDWIADDLAGWLAPNAVYPGVAAAVAEAMCAHETYIVTTKQAGSNALSLMQTACDAVCTFHPQLSFVCRLRTRRY